MDVINTKDLTEFSKDQKDKIDYYLRTYGSCYFETMGGKKVKDVIVKDPSTIAVMADFNDFNNTKYDSHNISHYIETAIDIKNGNSLLIEKIKIEKIKLTWYQKLMLKIVRLM